MTQRFYRIALASQISGVKEELIRQWERRYRVLTPARTPGGYRTYSDADIEVLKRLKALTAQGVSIAQAAQLLPTIRREVKTAAEAQPKAANAAQLLLWSEEIFASAARFDQQRVDAILGEALAAMPPLRFYDDFLGPLLKEVGDRWHSGTLSVAEEHLVSQVARQRMIALIANAPRRVKQHVICACPADEEHELGLLGVALHYRYAGWRVTYLGARTPAAQLARAAKGVRPQLIALSFIGTPKSPTYLEELAALLPENTRVVVGGAGAKGLKQLVKKLGFFFATTADESVVAMKEHP